MNGLTDAGIEADEVAELTGMSVKAVRAITRSKGQFSDAQLRAIEVATGRSSGQRALAAEPDVDATFAALIDDWAASFPHIKSPAAKSKKRPRKALST